MTGIGMIAVSFVGVIVNAGFILLFLRLHSELSPRDDVSGFFLTLWMGLCFLCSAACSVIVFLSAAGLLS
jgi:hypothetical protein